VAVEVGEVVSASFDYDKAIHEAMESAADPEDFDPEGCPMCGAAMENADGADCSRGSGCVNNCPLGEFLERG